MGAGSRCRGPVLSDIDAEIIFQANVGDVVAETFSSVQFRPAPANDPSGPGPTQFWQ